MISPLFDASVWKDVEGFEFKDITYHRHLEDGTVRIAFNRPEVRNAFRPNTVDELYTALEHARITSDVGCVLLTGNGPSPKDGGWAFCSGVIKESEEKTAISTKVQKLTKWIWLNWVELHILEVQRLIRFMPKVVIAVVPGWARGWSFSSCDLRSYLGF